MKTNYNKKALTFAEQIDLLETRGLIIDNKERALRYFTHINYYRLSAYIYPFLEDKEKHIFKEGTKFQDILNIYNFDRKFKLLIIDALERIEVSIRTSIIYVLSQKHDPFFLANKNLFYNQETYEGHSARLKDEIKRSDEKFIKHYHAKYLEEIPPAWITLEVVSFGLLSLLYHNLKSNKDKKEIASRYGLNHIVFKSWIHSLAYIRNVCAHHSRLWNRELGVSPVYPKNIGGLWLSDPTELRNDRIYIVVAIICYLLNTINPSSNFIKKLSNLFEKFPMVDLAPMGFPVTWKEEKLFETNK